MHYGLYSPEQTTDICQLFTQTFSDSEGEAEGKVIGELVTALFDTTPEHDRFVFVAMDEQTIVGSILFTRMTFDEAPNTTAYLLSPVAVHTAHQGKGIGQALINAGLATLKQHGITLAFTYGDPDFYSKVGFERITEAQYPAPQPLSYPHGWLAQSLTEMPLAAIAGASHCAPALNNPAYW
ncbi:N-acetyltransferase [Photobacterium japonica]|uniref:GNAT family N-acetyltransferase n=1 Tax=Photobacterium japonica TaxID=2910235 RepID=UPI003D11CDD0